MDGRMTVRIGILGVAAIAAGLGAWALAAGGGSGEASAGRGPDIIVSERGHAFAPSRITVARGDRIAVVNDDGNALHRPYVEGGGMSLDAGEQAAGARAVIPFDRRGSFSVLCGIHPAMRLDVEVR